LAFDDALFKIIPENMRNRGRIVLDALLSPIKDILSRQKFLDDPLSDLQIELLCQVLSSMDTDKDPKAARVGEREARIASPYISKLTAGFNHGVGRSGQLTGAQPKAVGATIMQQVTNHVALDAIRALGLPNVKHGLVTPLSTGMTIGLVFAALRRELGINQVLYPRIDHRSPHRGIALAGLTEIAVPTVLEEDAVRADLGELEHLMENRDNFAVLSTTTFFPPRESDPVKAIAKLCQEQSVPLVINNAYGVQSEEIMKKISSAIDAGRVDAIIQSGDKNFLAPVGSSVVVTPEKVTTDWIAESYAGRATAAPLVQTLAALLALGHKHYSRLQNLQKENRVYLETTLNSLASEIGQRLLSVDNPIACAITMDGLDVREIGGKLYNERVTGPRAIELGELGSCIDNYPHSYLVMNAAIGAKQHDISNATTKLNKVIHAYSGSA
jgi:O-phospho-L-seryl-tRNASec:L-selenocysteinyl-tRNA synthase